MNCTVSGYVIAKDEGQTIERTLLSLRGVCDEVIAGIDDASRDETESIARELADEVVMLRWNDDFSQARNQVLERCRGDWIVQLDGHEHFAVQHQPYPGAVFSLGEEAARLVRETILGTDRDKPQVKVIGCAVKIHCDENLIAQIVSVQERIFRRGLSYRNPVHNVLVGYQPEEAIGLLDLLILHDRPPQRERSRAEQRNEMLPRRMGERTRNNPDDLRSWSYLQRHAMVVADWPSVIRHGETYQQAAKRLQRDYGDEYYQSYLYNAVAYRLLDPPDYARAASCLKTCLHSHRSNGSTGWSGRPWWEWNATGSGRRAA